MVSIVLADDHAIVRQGLRALVEADPALQVVGEASDGIEAIELVKRRKPQILIVDLIMPNLDGLETTRRLTRMKSATRVIVLSVHVNEAYVLQALKNGAAGYVAKEASGAELLQAIRMVSAGRGYLSPRLYESFQGSYAAMGTPLHKDRTGAAPPARILTPRESKVLQLFVEGANSRGISVRLKIGHRTVESHRASIMRKLGLKTHAGLIRYALDRGIMPKSALKPKAKAR